LPPGLPYPAASRRAPPPVPAQTASAEEGFNDPYEDTNRGVFGFNKAVDDAVLVPVAKTYRTVVPPPMRQSLHDFMQEPEWPGDFHERRGCRARSVLAGNTLARLAINRPSGSAACSTSRS